MKTSTCIVALLLLASPLLAVPDTFASTSLKTFMAGTATVKYGKIADAVATNSKLYFEISGTTSLATAPPAAFCIVIGVPGTASTAADWKGADIGAYSVTYSTTTPFFAAASMPDLSCAATTATGTNNYCTTVGLAAAVTGPPAIPAAAEAGQNWAYPTATASDWIAYSAGTLKFEILRPNAATNTGVDLAYAMDTTKVLFAYTASACATNGATAEVTLTATDIGLVDPVTTGSGSGTSTSSFGSLTYISSIALLISYALLN